jgi:hypothetical protein
MVESWVEDLDRRSGIQLRMSHHFWQWPFRLVIDEAEIRRHDKMVLHCERATVSFRPSLARPFWHVTELALDRPSFYLEKDPSGRWSSSSERPDSQPPPSPSPSGSKGIDSARSITVRIESGTIVADQGGQQVLRVGNVAGRFTLPCCGTEGMNALLANLDSLQPAMPRGLSLVGGTGQHRGGIEPLKPVEP